MNILFLTDNFPPEVNAPASRTFEHCREWVRAGHSVTVITCVPNFPKGKVYKEYRNRIWQQEFMDGIRVVRVWTYISANKGFGKRILDYMSFMFSGFLAAFFVRRVDLVIGTSPQFFTVCAAYAVSCIKQIPYVFELRDLWPESIKAVGAMNDSLALRVLERLELFLYRKATGIITVTHSFRLKLIARGVEARKIAVITNGVDLSRFKPMDKDAALVSRYGLQGKFVAGYIGTHGMAHSLDTLLDAAERVQNTRGCEHIIFIFVGDGAQKEALQERARAMRLGNVLFIDSVEKEEVSRYWSLLDVSIIHLMKAELFTAVIPSKLFECMGMGIPVLHGVEGESSEIVVQEGLGMVFEPENVDELCKGLSLLEGNRCLLERMHNRCLVAGRRYERGALAAGMLSLLEQVHSTGVFSRISEEAGRLRGDAYS